MKGDFYKKLVDMYAGDELPQELADEMEMEAFSDPELGHDMSTLRKTVQILRSQPKPEFTEESYQRILMKLYARGAEVQTSAPEPAHLQYHLPIQPS
jgi:anti-sigma factor RsiW